MSERKTVKSRKIIKSLPVTIRLRTLGRFALLCISTLMTTALLGGCGYLSNGLQAKPTYNEAGDYFSQGRYTASLSKYQQILDAEPEKGDRALFEMGIIHSYPGNQQKDYQKALESFQRLIRDYPVSSFKKDSELMVFNISNVIQKDRTIESQQKHIDILQQETKKLATELASQQSRVQLLEQEIKTREQDNSRLKLDLFISQKGKADKILVQKKERQLSLFSKGRLLKSYKIALGGDPVGPKERQGDNKTPEGTYLIDAKNKNSRFHLSLHISYPNEKDKKRARQLGVSPGGDIMIHGIKNELAWVGERHAEVDWTQGCIAVSDEEIEEINRLVPIGTAVEIRP
jgi:tetratricopeptide (TPR) repeat protein